jgi:hypothetical protein
MGEFTYTTVPGKIKELLEKIRSVGVPPKATAQWLKSIGFTSSNDTSLLSVLKFIEFCDQAGTPSDSWKRFRGSDHAHVLANSIRGGYRDLFDIYDDAYQRSDTELTSFFTTRSNAGRQAIAKTVSTFRSLCSAADFTRVTADAPEPGQSIEDANPSRGQPASPPILPSRRASGSGPSLHIDLQIHIAADASTDQIDQIFKSMAKHLYGRSDE